MEFREHGPNNETYRSRIVLNFMRHAEKESDKSKSDYEIRITDAGKEQAVAKSRSKTNLPQSVAFGGERKRTRETAGLAMAGSQERIMGDEGLEELEAKLNTDLGFGGKIGIDRRLDFNVDSTDYEAEVVAAMKKGEYLNYLVNESDAAAKKLGERGDLTYSRTAALVAEVVKKYLEVSPRFDQLVTDKGYEKIMERFLGTNQGRQEVFLAKVIEKTKGLEERNKFVEINKNGFDFTEGFTAEINNYGLSEPELRVRYEKKDSEGSIVYKFEEVIPLSIINEIIEEGKE